MESMTDRKFDTMPRWSSIVVGGPDAASFLQGQLSQDITTVGPAGVWSLLLAPDGIVITSIYVAAIPDGYTLSLARELGDVALARLRRFLLRTACTLELIELDHGPYDTRDEQIDAGRPGPAEFARGLTPQCFGGAFVASTVSFTKGCFTGQELVGRLDARGSSVPWRMVRASGRAKRASTRCSRRRVRPALRDSRPRRVGANPSSVSASHTGACSRARNSSSPRTCPSRRLPDAERADR